MSGFSDSLVGFLQKSLGAVAPAAEVAEKVDSALSKSVTFTEVLNGMKAASGLPWAEIEKALSAHFSNVQDDLSTVEDMAKAIAPFAPDAMYVSDVAAALLLLVKLGAALPPSLQIVKTVHGGTKPIFGKDNPVEDADWGKIAGF
jgi:hypothetical protein